MKSKVSYAVAAILSGVSLGALAAQPAPRRSAADTTVPAPQALATDANRDQGSTAAGASSSALREIIVTATHRAENIQDVPITMRALTARTLQNLNIHTFEDYVRQLPNLTSADHGGPGQNQIFMRGLGAGSQATQASGVLGLWPLVAVYLDNQSVQLPNRNLDIYAVDLNRIEVLEGPQGTLYGAGAEAGAIRYITNKPKLDEFSGDFSGGYGITAHGDPNTALSGVINLPVIRHHMAIRLVVYSNRRGGYIDNVHGTFTRHNTDIGIHYANFPAVNGQCPNGEPNTGYCVPPGSPVADNLDLVKNNFNPVTYQGVRAEALYKFNDDWSLLVTQMYQNLDAEGVFFQYPKSTDGQTLKPLQVDLFVPTYNRDKFSNTAWTVKGKLGFLRAIYTGGFLARDSESQTDYTNYNRGVFGDYYQCFGPGSGYDYSLKSTCYSAVTALPDYEQNKHFQNELRLQTPDDWRLRGTVGFYQENDKVYEQGHWEGRTVPTCTSNGPAGSPGNTGCFAREGNFPGSTVRYPGLINNRTNFNVDTYRQVRQYAEYASASFDLTQHLTLTAGTRHFVFLNSLEGSVLSGFGCFEAGVPPTGCHTIYSDNLNALNLRSTESGWRSRANLSWHINPILFGNKQHIMTYFTFSQGFRPGGFNQNGGQPFIPGADGQAQYLIPKAYQSDSVDNYEIGWKTNWRIWGRSFQWNAAFYRENWLNAQVGFFDPPLFSTLFIDVNGQNFRIDGSETSFSAQLWRGLWLQGAAAWNSSEQLNSPQLIDNNPLSANFGKPITEQCSGGTCQPVINPFGPRGAPTAYSPPIHYTLLLHYDFETPFGYLARIQFGANHVGHSFTQSGANPPFVPGVTVSTSRIRFEDPAYTTYSASIGLSKGKWSFTAYGENLTDSNAAVFTSTDNFIVAQTPLRPRVLGARFEYRF